jgi:hypothetical protein
MGQGRFGTPVIFGYGSIRPENFSISAALGMFYQINWRHFFHWLIHVLDPFG